MESISSRLSPSPPLENSIVKVKKLRKLSIAFKWKEASYQNFQGYAKPLRLLPASEPKFCTNGSSDKLVNLFQFESLYTIKLETSKNYGSELTDTNSGVSICLIDENGSSILQRFSATVSGNSGDMDMNNGLHFQRGSIDEFAFEGSNLGRIVAVWIGLESGQWRISGLNLTVLSLHQHHKSSEENIHPNLCYHFEIDNILLGDKTEFSMMEFRPHTVTLFSPDESTLLDEQPLNPSNEESMKQYADLKFSLLLYDALLVLGGATFISVSSVDDSDASYAAFLAGGLVGFFYLLLIQRSVDGLSPSDPGPGEKKATFHEILGGLRNPILGCVVFVLSLKYSYGFKLASEDIIFGMMGFVMCKVAVVMAAFKPLQISFKR